MTEVYKKNPDATFFRGFVKYRGLEYLGIILMIAIQYAMRIMSPLIVKWF